MVGRVTLDHDGAGPSPASPALIRNKKGLTTGRQRGTVVVDSERQSHC